MARGSDPSQTWAHLTVKVPESIVKHWCMTISAQIRQIQGLVPSAPPKSCLCHMQAGTAASNSRHHSSMAMLTNGVWSVGWSAGWDLSNQFISRVIHGAGVFVYKTGELKMFQSVIMHKRFSLICLSTLEQHCLSTLCFINMKHIYDFNFSSTHILKSKKKLGNSF